jgi:hypothetical protein
MVSFDDIIQKGLGSTHPVIRTGNPQGVTPAIAGKVGDPGAEFLHKLVKKRQDKAHAQIVGAAFQIQELHQVFSLGGARVE